jgi:AraC-like DNA-binding protein
MKETTVIAGSKHYFDHGTYPVTVLRVRADGSHRPSHPHDLTEVEHEHDFCELAVVTGGSARHSLEGRNFPVTAGDVFVLQGHQKHFFHDCDALELINVMYDPNRIPLPESELRQLPGYCALFILEPNYRHQHRFTSRLHLQRTALGKAEAIIREMEIELNEGGAGCEAVLYTRLLDLMVYLSRAYLSSGSTEAQALLRVGHVICELERNYAHPWTLDELMALCGMSRSTLMRVFRKATNQTPVDYLVRLRIQKSMELLKQTSLTITQIALDVGFNDSNYYSRQFRKAHGCSPSEYRRRS